MAFIDKEDLHTNGMLISDANLKKIKELRRRDRVLRHAETSILGIHHASGGKLSKKLLNAIGISVNFSILICREHGKDSFYAIYRGYKQHRHLGKGAYGTVKLAQDLQNGELLALKIQPWSALSLAGKRLLREETLKSRLAGALVAATPFRTIQNKTAYAMLMKLHRGKSLRACINMNLSMAERIKIAMNAIDHLKEIHAKNIIHLDIKPENIIVNTHTGSVDIIDFGVAQLADKHGEAKAGKTGTLLYMPPEAYIDNRQLKSYSFKSDIYSLGITLASLFKLTETDKHVSEQHLCIRKHTQSYSLTNNTATTTELLAVFNGMTAAHPSDRIDLDTVKARLSNILTTLPDSMTSILYANHKTASMFKVSATNDPAFTGRILPDDVYHQIIQAIKSTSLHIKSTDTIKFSKNDLLRKFRINSPYSIIVHKVSEKIFKIYAICEKINNAIKIIQDQESGKYYLLKIKPFNNSNKSEFTNEVNILRKMNMLRTYFIYQPTSKKGKLKYRMPIRGKTLDEPAAFGIIMPYYPGKTLNPANINPSTHNLEEIFLQMAQQVKQAHDHHILHNDIKPENFIYDCNRRITHLVDYGAALDLSEPRPHFLRVGTHHYLPQNMLNKHFHELSGKTTDEIFKIDIHSLGITMARLAGLTLQQQMPYQLDSNLPDHPLTNLIKKMVTPDPAIQPDIQQVIATLQTNLAANTRPYPIDATVNRLIRSSLFRKDKTGKDQKKPANDKLFSH